MHYFRTLSIAAFALASAAACSDSADDPEGDVPETPAEISATVLDLEDVKTNTADYDWFDFRPNVQKLILAGAAETEHIAILWYTVPDGGVNLHYHAKTESVYVIDGTQTDAKGSYPTGTVYFNPPGSGHQITDSSGFFLLAYASPPDFASTDQIGEYTPIRVDTDDAELTMTYPFDEESSGVRLFAPPLDAMGGLGAEFLEVTSSGKYEFEGNYLLVLEGSCDVEGVAFGKDKLIVAETVEPESFEVTATKKRSCLAMGVSF
jgi:hypothetical protein